MPEQRDDVTGPGSRDLEAALRRLGDEVAVPASTGVAVLVRDRLTAGDAEAGVRRAPSSTRPSRRVQRPVMVVIALAVLVAAVLSVPRTRHAVADLLGLSGVAIHRTHQPGPVPPRSTLDQALDLGRAASLSQARELVGFPIALPSDPNLGAPDAAYVRRADGLRAVNLVYRPRPGLTPAPDTRVGLLLSEYAGTATPYFDKYVTMGVPLRRVTVAGSFPGLYFPGATQILVRGTGGSVHDVYPRLAAPSLIWVRGEITYRLEANVSRARALSIAASIR